MKEQRRVQKRINYLAHALVSSGTGETIKGLIRDISPESIYLYIDPIFELDSPVNIEIILLGANSQLTVKMPARVARKDQHGVAMIFFTPLEWWPIFTYFPSYNLDGLDSQEGAGTALPGHCQKIPAAFQGDLSIITIENLMQLVSHAALSGELKLSTPGNSAVFYVHKGTLVYGYLEKNAMRTGQRLIQANYITKENLQECLLLCRKKLPQPKIGKILVEKGYLKQEDLEKVIKELIKAVFFEVLSWKEGFFTFSIKEIPSGECIFLEERIDHLILAGIINLENSHDRL
ncbi:MAG: DUF4388 domain-containing protein [Proteobacteria bacterium]|nr:DUF4388 domain-containing protein [Pseudomonadota bacterium]MBU1058433.1 DUF4388 domain-containing protein [Pseudomonadota bacterium]